jgi:hypothetical protein
MTRITVAIPKARVEGIRDGLRTSQLVLAEEVQIARQDEPRSRRLVASTKRLAELTDRLDQLSHWTPNNRTITGQYEPLHAAACDTLIIEIEHLACAAHSHWNQRPNLGRLRQRLGAVTGCAALLEQIEEARTRNPSPGPA